MKKNIYFFIFGGGGGPEGRQTQGYQIFREVRPHHRADKCITRKTITASFSYMGHNVKKCAFLAILFIFGGSWDVLTSNPGLPNFQGSKISLQSRQIYNKEKN